MTTHTGYLLIADISGYTQFLTSSELEHANPNPAISAKCHGRTGW
ncbi:hypothetical protein [Parasedimentitalea denitrificans]|nr:hypothetical protein [Sedimentitalea sp. CY04]